MRTGAWLIGFLLNMGVLSAQNASQILDKTARTYAQMRSLRVESRSTASGTFQSLQGEMTYTNRATLLMMVMRPNKVRIDTLQTDNPTLSLGKLRCDGEVLYIESAALRQTQSQPAPKTLREIYTTDNLSVVGLMVIGLDPIRLLIDPNWRTVATSPKLIGRERVGNRQTYKVQVQLKEESLKAFAQGQTTQTLWIGTKDSLIWKSEITINFAQAGTRMAMRLTEVFTRQEVNPPINPTAFAYRLPEGFKMVQQFEMPDFTEETGKLKGQPAGDFALSDLQGKPVRLADYKGKVVVLNVFAHWCGPCRAEAPELEKDLWQAYKDKGVVVLGVATWAQDNPTKRAQDFAREFKLTFPVLVDSENKVAEQYRVSGVPTTFVIDQEGVVREVVVGADVQRVKRAVEALLQGSTAENK
ncbi:Peroxiredoxin [Armatimonadetes bacterium GXS]|nr:Peroxiredoxin [Armatimonadetes bacterium GXS]